METFFQFYPGKITDCRPSGWISLNRFIEAIRNPKPQTITIFETIAACEISGDKAGKARAKQQLPKFTPPVHVAGWRNYKNIVGFTGLMTLDFDHIEDAPGLKDHLFNFYPCITACWLSPSRRGVKALVLIPKVETVQQFKQYFFGMAAELQEYEGFDETTANPVLDLFLSYDPDILVRTNPATWHETGINTQAFDETPMICLPTHHKPSGASEQRIIKMIDSALDKITDNGHPQLRSLCVAVGGYIANNYIDFNTAIQYINYKISVHPYLKKGVAGYQKTAAQMLRFGMVKPLTLNTN